MTESRGEYIQAAELDTYKGQMALRVRLWAPDERKSREVILPCAANSQVAEWAEECRAVFDAIAPRKKGRPRKRNVAVIEGDAA